MTSGPPHPPNPDGEPEPTPAAGPAADAAVVATATARAALTAMGFLPDSQLDLAEAALMLAVPDAPELSVDLARAHLAQLVAEARAMAAEDSAARHGDLAARAALLAALLHHRHGYRGDTETFDDLANANLLRCIGRRKGLPVALGVIWLHVARALGWEAYGLDVPAHFLIALGAGDLKLAVDVFEGGVALDPAALRALLKRVTGGQADQRSVVLRPMGNRAILVRLVTNIITRRLRAGKAAGALAAIEDILRCAPQETPLWREAGLLNARLEKLAAASACLRRFVELTTDPDARRHAEAMLTDLRNRLN